MKTIIWKQFEFEAAHFLPFHQGNCRNLHGHSYKLQVGVTGEPHDIGPQTGMIMDFGDLKLIVKNVFLDDLDHSTLNKIFENPTAEVMARWMFDELKIRIAGLYGVRLWETSGSYCEVIE